MRVSGTFVARPKPAQQLQPLAEYAPSDIHEQIDELEAELFTLRGQLFTERAQFASLQIEMNKRVESYARDASSARLEFDRKASECAVIAARAEQLATQVTIASTQIENLVVALTAKDAEISKLRRDAIERDEPRAYTGDGATQR